MRKVLIIDESALVRERIRQLLSGVQGLEVTAEAQRTERGVALAKRLRPDVVIVDVHLRAGRGIELLREMKRARPTPRIIVLTNEAYPEIRNRCLAAGADYFFDKSTEYEQMVNVLSERAIGAATP
jgi:DNA-binding NarL/FixJ family response regulator